MLPTLYQWFYRHQKTILFIFPAILVFIANLTFFNRYFPLSESWWETYGYLVNSGLVPYKDFSLEFTPLFVFLNAFFLKITSSFFLLRLWGVALVVINTILIQRLIGKVLNKTATAIGVIIAIFLFMSDHVYIAKDYQTYQITLTALTLLVGIKLQQKALLQPLSGWRPHTSAFFLACLLGIFIGLVSMIKQNIGAFLMLAYLLNLSLEIRRVNLKVVMTLAISVLLGIGIIWALLIGISKTQGVPSSDFYALFFQNDSKGSLFVILARIFLDPINRKILALSIAITIVGRIVVTRNSLIPRGKIGILWQKNWFASTITTAGALALSVLIWEDILPLVSLSLAVLWYVCCTTYFSQQKSTDVQTLRFLLIPFLALVYCNTQSASFNYTGLIFINAFSFAYLAQQITVHFKTKPPSLYGLKITFLHTYMALILFTMGVTAYKWYEPYNWWGLQQSSIFNAHYTLDYPETRGIRVDQATQQAFQVISQNIRTFSHSDSDVYLFPDIPIFYLLEKKKAPYYNVVEWFDVLGSVKGQQEFQQFKTHLPNVVVYLDPPDFVYEGHAKLIQRPLVQVQFKNLLNNLVNSGAYVAKTYIYNQKLNKIFYSPINAAKEREFIVQNPLLFNKPLSFLVTALSEKINEFTVTGLHADHSIWPNYYSSQQLIHPGDVLSVRVGDVDLQKASNFLGYENSREYYIIRIYIKSSAFNSYAKTTR